MLKSSPASSDSSDKPTVKYVKASILPFCIVHTDCVALLLAKLRPANWVKSKILHSDFGGRISPEDNNDINRCASREFLEESLGMVDIPNCTMTLDGITDYLRQKKYFAKIETSSSSRDQHVFVRVTFLIHIPFDPYVSKHFLLHRERLHKACSTQVEKLSTIQQYFAKKQAALDLKDNTYKMKACYNEMEDLNYFSLDYVTLVCQNKFGNKRLSLLHNCRKRMLQILPVLQAIQSHIRHRDPT